MRDLASLSSEERGRYDRYVAAGCTPEDALTMVGWGPPEAVKTRGGLRATPELCEEYIRLVGSGLNKSDAAAALGANLHSVARMIGHDPGLKARLEEAWWAGAEPLIEEARRRGVEGWDEPIYQKGELVGHVRKYDSNLLMFSIKGRRPEYKDVSKVDVNTAVQVKFEDRSAKVQEMWRVLADAGVDPQEILDGGAAEVGGGSVVGGLPAAPVVVAEPADVQPEAGGVPGSSEP